MKLRSFAGELVGARRGLASLRIYTCTQKDRLYDPTFDATCPLVARYACWLWDGRTSPSMLRMAWSTIRDKLGAQGTWRQCFGPISAVFLSLRRIGWNMAAPHLLTSDLGDHISLYEYSPSEVRNLLRDGVERWLWRRVPFHWPEASGSEYCWARAMRLAILALPAGARQGSLRALWSGGLWPPARKHAEGLAPSAACTFCQAPQGTLGHKLYDCSSAFVSGEEDAGSLGFPEDVWERRQALREKEYDFNVGPPDWDRVPLLYGLPSLPIQLPPPLARTPVLTWGLADGPWGRYRFTDGGRGCTVRFPKPLDVAGAWSRSPRTAGP
jgi:hypothetical protein